MESISIERRAAKNLRSRKAMALRGILITGGVLLAVPVIAWLVVPRLSFSSEESGAMLATVFRGPFVYDITERGNIESAKNVEITCKVKSRSGGVAIIEVVPEGTIIKPEYCVPEDAIIPLEAVQQVVEWRLKNGFKLAGLPTPTGLPPIGELPPGPEPTDVASQSDAGDVAAGADSGSGSDSSDTATGSEDGSATAASASPDQLASNGQQQSDGSAAAALIESEEAAARAEETLGRPVLTFEDLKDKMILVKLNSKELEDQLIQQRIVCENSASQVIQAKEAVETAKIALKEYLEGKYHEELQDLQRQLVEAQEAHSRAQEYLSYSEILYSKGFISDNELAANRFDVTKTKLAVDMIQTRIKVLEEYTKEKMVGQLEADIATAEARLRAAEQSHQLDMNQLREIEEQIVNCTIFARHPGQVVYANQTNRWGSNEIVIEPGAMIRERQTILRLPDPTQMQVNAKINEARVALIEPGMPATIRLEASPNEVLHGEVVSVADYPAPTSWFRGDVKEYEVLVKIQGLEDKPRNDLRPGFTAEVSIRVAQLPDALQLPIQAVLEHGGKYYCIVPKGEDEFEAKEVQIGMSNDKFVVIEGGLEEGDQVVQNALKYRDKVDLPEIKQEPVELAVADQVGPAGESQGLGGARADGSMAAGAAGPRRPGAAGPGGASGGAAAASKIFSSLDRNGDGKLTGEEIPAQMRQFTAAVDNNGDGAIDQSELAAAMRRRAAARGGQRPGGGGPQRPGPGNPGGARTGPPGGGAGRPGGGRPGGLRGGRP